MDIVKYGLIGALVFVALSLTTRWQEFSADQAETQIQQSVGINNEENAALPSPVSDDDFDGIEQNIPSANVAVDTTINQTEIAPSNLITVTTDTIIVKIDPRGGDIVQVALRQHLAKLEEKGLPFLLLDNSQRLMYVAQSGMTGKNGTEKSGQRPLFSTAKRQYQLADSEQSLNVDLKITDNTGSDITKRFIFTRDSYLINIENIIQNNSDSVWQAAMFAQIKRDNSQDPGAESGGMGMQPFLGVATTSAEENYLKMTFEDMAEEPYKKQTDGGWISMVQHYFISAWIPPKDQIAVYSTKVTKGGANIIRYTSPEISIEPGQRGTLKADFYAGPKDQYRLKEISPHLDLTVDYGFLWWLAQPLFWLLTKLHSLIGNWGFSIIALTIVVKALFFKLSAASYRSMAKMRTVAPKMQELKERHGDDRQKMSQATMELYKKEKINPLGGCLPILIQMPVFIALYWTLMESVELRHAPFILWIKDLSAMDPYYVLPLIMGASMWAQQRLNPAPPDPMQAKMMQWMPVVFTFLFLWFPAGLVVYWVTNNLLSIAQQWAITRQIEAEAAKKA